MNMNRLKDFIKMVKSRANARIRAAKYYEDNSTLKGFKGTEDSEYSPTIEAKIQRVIDANPGSTREQVIEQLKKAGKL